MGKGFAIQVKKGLANCQQAQNNINNNDRSVCVFCAFRPGANMAHTAGPKFHPAHD
jgi:hypothetical protein